MSTTSFKEAFALAQQAKPRVPFDPVGYENDECFLVLPHDDAPEGTPGFYVYKATGSLVVKGRKHEDEIKRDFFKGILGRYHLLIRSMK